MMQMTVASRYAEALFAIAKEKNQLEEIEKELKTIDTVLLANPELDKLLNHPHIDKVAKKEMLLSIFAGNLSETTENFLQLLIDKKRQDGFTYIVKAFTSLANEARGLVDATVITAKPVTDKQLETISKRFKDLIGKDLRIATEIKEEILGGFLVRIGDRVYDSSIQSQLKRFQVELQETQIGR